jgi:hypothetical protein
VKATASEITKGSKTDVEKARAIYEWIVDNTFRNPNTRGGGGGDIRFMLESRDLGGKCADQTLHSEHYVPPSLSAPRTHGRLRGKPSKHPSYLQLQVFDESCWKSSLAAAREKVASRSIRHPSGIACEEPAHETHLVNDEKAEGKTYES